MSEFHSTMPIEGQCSLLQYFFFPFFSRNFCIWGVKYMVCQLIPNKGACISSFFFLLSFLFFLFCFGEAFWVLFAESFSLFVNVEEDVLFIM